MSHDHFVNARVIVIIVVGHNYVAETFAKVIYDPESFSTYQSQGHRYMCIKYKEINYFLWMITLYSGGSSKADMWQKGFL